MYIGEGAHVSATLDSDEGCLMEWKYRLCTCVACTEHKAQDVALIDCPPCTNTLIAKAAQGLNDRVDDEHRQGLAVFLSRIDRCRKTSRDDQIAQRLTAWAAEDVRAMWGAEHSQLSAVSITNSKQVRINAMLAAMNAVVDIALVDDSQTDTDAARIAFFDRLLDAWEKAAVEEGVLTEIDPSDYCDFTAVGN